MNRTACMLLIGFACVGFAGCASDNEDLQQWMAEQRRITTPKVTPISEPTRYMPLAYAGGASVDAFAGERLTRALRRDDIGRIARGYRADFAVLEAPSYLHLAYRPGMPIAHDLRVGGRVS